MTTLLHGVSWETYESLLCDFQDRSAPRFAYDRGTLEIMSPLLPEHETRSRVLEQIVLIIADEWDIDVQSFGSTTFRQPEQQRGFEPDESFYIQSVGLLPASRSGIDPRTLPPPDLVVEVDITNPSLDKLPLYATLGVGEVWRDDGRDVNILRRAGDSYVPELESVVLTGMTGVVLTRFVTLSQTATRPIWRREVQAWARANQPGGANV